jgi:ABC-2 type transport system permease protein
MIDQPQITARKEPGEPIFHRINLVGVHALYVKEVRRFFKVQLQTIWAPAFTTLLYLIIFTVALGRQGHMVMGQHLADFLAPGLIVMGMMQNAFANSSFALLVGKMQGTIVDYLMPPISTGELIAAIIGGAVTRAILVGAVVWLAMLCWPGVNVMPQHLWAVLWFGLNGAILLAFLGLITSMWADKFDHAAAVTNFVVQPLSLLSGTFYAVDRLAPAFQAISHANPIFYIISGFRYGFLGVTDSPIMIGALGLLGLNIAVAVGCYHLLRNGWRIKS